MEQNPHPSQATMYIRINKKYISVVFIYVSPCVYIICFNRFFFIKSHFGIFQTVTFQVVMITDYVNTYAKVIYNDREMTWDVLRNSVKNYPVRIGLLKQNETAQEYPQSYLSLVSSPEDKDKIQRIDDVTPTSLKGDVKWVLLIQIILVKLAC